MPGIRGVDLGHLDRQRGPDDRRTAANPRIVADRPAELCRRQPMSPDAGGRGLANRVEGADSVASDGDLRGGL